MSEKIVTKHKKPHKCVIYSRTSTLTNAESVAALALKSTESTHHQRLPTLQVNICAGTNCVWVLAW